jgi:hypothetical protein
MASCKVGLGPQVSPIALLLHDQAVSVDVVEPEVTIRCPP